MAIEPGNVTPEKEPRRRLRLASLRGRGDGAPAEAPETPETPPAEAADEAAAPRDDERPAGRAPKEKRRSGGAGAFLKTNARLVVALVLLVLGVVLVILGWYGAAHTNILTEQIPYFISGGLLGMALIIVAGVVGSSASLERENREMRRELTRAMRAAPAERRSSPYPLSAVPSAQDGHVYVVPGGRSFHFAGCPLVEGKNGSELSIEDAMASGFATCKLCGPD
jgi:hypothetical protein